MHLSLLLPFAVLRLKVSKTLSRIAWHIWNSEHNEDLIAIKRLISFAIIQLSKDINRDFSLFAFKDDSFLLPFEVLWPKVSKNDELITAHMGG